MFSPLLPLALLLGPSAQDDAAPRDLPAGADLMDRFQGAVVLEGGDLESLESLEHRGTAAWEGLETTGRVTVTRDLDGNARIVTEFGEGAFVLATNGEFVWEETPLGVTVRVGPDAAAYLREFALKRHDPWREIYASATTTGREEVDGRAAWVVELRPRGGEDDSADVVHLDAETHLLLRSRFEGRGMLGEEAVRQVEHFDWKSVDGVLYPHRERITVSGFRLDVEYDSIRHGVEIPEGFFEPSEAVLEALEEERSGERARRDDEIVVEDLEERHVASIRVTTEHADMQRILSALLPEAFEYVASTGTAMAGPPLVRYHAWGDPVDLEAAIPVREPVTEGGRVRARTLPAGRAVVAWHVGPYERLGETHERVQAYMAEHGLVRRAAPWEEYWTDPGMEPDPSRWRTRIVWPVEDAPEEDAEGGTSAE